MSGIIGGGGKSGIVGETGSSSVFNWKTSFANDTGLVTSGAKEKVWVFKETIPAKGALQPMLITLTNNTIAMVEWHYTEMDNGSVVWGGGHASCHFISNTLNKNNWGRTDNNNSYIISGVILSNGNLAVQLYNDHGSVSLDMFMVVRVVAAGDAGVKFLPGDE